MEQTLESKIPLSNGVLECRNALKVDDKLRFGRENFEELLKPLVLNDKELYRIGIDKDAFPSDYELAQISNLIYTEKFGGEADESYEERLNLPSGWRLLATASNADVLNGYFGAAFVNITKRHIVVAHRGSEIKNIGSLWSDVFGIVFQNYVPRMSSAVTFVEHITSMLSDVPAVGLTFTGHSLGGWLAQITCFTSMYLRKNESSFVKKNPSHAMHSHAVVFDSPGCRDMLLQLKEVYDLRYDSTISFDNMDITTYVSAPNRINTIKVHFGNLYRIFPDFSDMNYLDKWFLYSVAVHRMYKIARVFEKETGNVRKDETGQYKIQVVRDWPISGALRKGEEYDNFFKWAKPFNNYHPELTDENFTSEQNISLRYRTKKFDEERCSLRIFAANELHFLKWWLYMKNVKLEKLENFTTEYGLGDYKKLFPNFTIDNSSQTIWSSSLTFLINRTKQLFRLFSTKLMMAVKENSAPLSVIETVLMVFDSVVQWDVNFYGNDKIGLREFLDSETQEVLCITTPDTQFETLRTHELCQQIQNVLDPKLCARTEEKPFGNSHRIVLSWQQLLSLDKFVDIAGIMERKWKYDLIIVTYPSHSELNEESKVVLDSLILVREISCRKIIFITSEASALYKYISLPKNMGKLFIHKDIGSISFSDLSQESQSVLLKKPVISLHGNQYTLADLFKIREDSIDRKVIERVNRIINSKLLKSIMDPNSKIVQIRHKLMEFHDQEVSYVKICKAISAESAADFLLNANNILQNFTKQVLFFLSGIPRDTDYAEEIFRRLHITDEGKRNHIRVALQTNIFIQVNTGNTELRFKQFCRDPKCYENVVFWMKINDENATLQQVYDKRLYIARKFKFKSKCVMKTDILEKIVDKSNKDLYIFGNCSKKYLKDIFAVPQDKVEEFENGKKIITQCNERSANAKFEEIINKRQGAIHLVKVEKSSKELIWLKSSGSLDSIRNYSLADSFTVNEQSFSERGDKVVILSGDPATGKSITLCSLSRQVKSTWVIHKDLKNYLAIMQLPHKLVINDAVRFLIEGDSFMPDNAAVLLKACMTEEDAIPVLVIFDGFDEIKKVSLKNKKFTKKKQQIAQEKVLQLLEFLKDNTRANIWITTRSLQSKMLENQLSVFSTKFEELEIDELKQYLKRFWVARLSIELKQYGEIEHQMLERYLDELFAEAKSIFGKEISTYVGVPLQMRMIAEIALPHVQELLTSDLNNPSNLEISSQIKNIFDLYQRFIETKYELYVQSSTRSPKDENRKKRLIKEHRYLSFQLLFPNDAKEFLGEKTPFFSKDNWMDVGMELNRVGLIRSNMKGEFDFLHHTFADFFVAELFLSWLSRPQGHQKYPEYLISKILLSPDYKVIRLFLNNHLSSHKLPQDALKFYGKRFITAWQKDRTIFFDRKRQTALHMVSAENCGYLVRFILSILDANEMPLGSLNSTALVAARDQGGKTALYLASKYKCEESMSTFLDYLKNCVSRISQQQILLCTLYRKSKDKDDSNKEYLLKSVRNYEEINKICSNIHTEWDSITEFLTNARRDLFRDFLFSGFYTTVDQYLLMIHKPLETR